MTLKAYSAYRPSRTNWLDHLPEHWDERRGKFLFDLKQRRPEDSAEIVTAFRDGRVTLRRLRREDGFTVALKESGYQGVRQGDLVIHAMDAFAGAVGVSDSDGKCSPVYSCCRPQSGVSADFYAYFLRAMALHGYIESLAKGIRERSTDFRWGDFGNLRLPVPPLIEQLAIVDYLHHETARIDALIEEQKRLIDLLHEKRQAQISKSVLTSTCSNADLRHSGREALGYVPDHWEIMPLRYAIDFLEGPGILAHDFAETGVPLLRIGNLKPGYVELRGCNWLTSEDVESRWHKYRTRTGDLLISGSASTDLISEVDENSQGSIPYTGIIIIRPKSGVMTKEFTKWLLQADEFKVQVDRLKAGSTIQHFGPMHLNQMHLAVPPVDEQEEISERLKDLDFRQSKLIQSAREGVELLESRRNSLISAAVTGKIDVRDSNRPTPSDEEVFPQVAEKDHRYG